MNSDELTRFLQSVRTSPKLMEELRNLLSTPDAAIHWAGSQGYRLTPGDIAEIQGCNQELSEDELDQVAGGDTAWPPPPSGGG
jgi:predicted ribosomally synthesized peptide with nif11-like leader